MFIELINYIIIITMFAPFTLFHVDRHLKKLDNHSQYSVEQIGSDCTRIDLRASVFQNFSGGACPRTPAVSAGFAPTFVKTLSRPAPLIKNIFLRLCILPSFKLWREICIGKQAHKCAHILKTSSLMTNINACHIAS